MMTSHEINTAAEANMLTHMSWIQSRINGMQVVADPQLTLIDSGLPTDSFNFVCRARLEMESIADRIRDVLHHFRSAARPFSWWVGPVDRPVDLGEHLLQAGFKAADGDVAMAADLDVAVQSTNKPSGLRIERVSNATQIREFADLVAANWTPPDLAVVRFYDMATPLLLQRDCPIRLYVGYLRGKVVATAEITAANGVAGVYNVATRATHRRRGIGTAMMLRALQDARAEGFDTAVLQASRDGHELYVRIGFQAVGEFVEYKTEESQG